MYLGLSSIRVGSQQVFSGGAPAYLGQVATRCSMQQIKSPNSLTQVQNRRYHYARDDISEVRLVFSNWYENETSTGASATIRGSVEYPAGTTNQLLFSGSAEGTIPAGGHLISDPVTLSVPIPDGAKFWTRLFYTCANGIPYNNASNGDSANGDSMIYAASGLDDYTMTPTFPPPTSGDFFHSPAAILAMTKKPSLLLVGDSRQYGASDSSTGISGDNGQIARSVGPNFAYINTGINSTTAATYMANRTNRDVLAQYCSHVVSCFGINDISVVEAANVYANLATLRNLYPTAKFFQATVPVRSTSSDSFATLNNQTPWGYESRNLELNTLIRANSNGFDGVLDIEGVVNDPNGSGNRAWIPTYTNDGVHETNLGNIAIKDSGIISPGLFVR